MRLGNLHIEPGTSSVLFLILSMLETLVIISEIAISLPPNVVKFQYNQIGFTTRFTRMRQKVIPEIRSQCIPVLFTMPP